MIPVPKAQGSSHPFPPNVVYSPVVALSFRHVGVVGIRAVIAGTNVPRLQAIESTGAHVVSR